MAHNISQDADGQYEAIYTGDIRDVWHRLGQYVVTITKDLARKVLDKPMDLLAAYYHAPLPGGDSVQKVSSKARIVYRTDTGVELASVGAGYELVPHSYALLDAVEPILDSGLADLDAVGLLRDGARGWSLLQWNVDKFSPLVREVYRDEIKVYGLNLSSVDGRSNNSYRPVRTRGVCENTIGIGMAEGAMFASYVVHRKNARVRTVDAVQEAFKHVVAQEEATAREYLALKRTQLDKALWKELVGKVAMGANPREDSAYDASNARDVGRADRWRDKANGIYRLWTEGKGHEGNRSAWEAFNGLVESMDHDDNAWRARSAENKVLSLTDGPMAATRNAVYSGLIDHCRKVGTLVS